MTKVLIVEDDRIASKLVCDWLKQQNYTVEQVFDGKEAMYRLSTFDYDIIILDWELPLQSGVQVLSEYRAKAGSAPVLLLTGRKTIDDKEIGFDSGADDYLTKPFELRELSARLRALLQRPKQRLDSELQVGPLMLDSRRREVTVNDEILNLTPVEYSVMEYFMKRVDEVISADALLNTVWSSESEATSLAIRTTISRLRKKLKEKTDLATFENEYGSGYRIIISVGSTQDSLSAE